MTPLTETGQARAHTETGLQDGAAGTPGRTARPGGEAGRRGHKAGRARSSPPRGPVAARRWLALQL